MVPAVVRPKSSRETHGIQVKGEVHLKLRLMTDEPKVIYKEWKDEARGHEVKGRAR